MEPRTDYDAVFRAIYAKAPAIFDKFAFKKSQDGKHWFSSNKMKIDGTESKNHTGRVLYYENNPKHLKAWSGDTISSISVWDYLAERDGIPLNDRKAGFRHLHKVAGVPLRELTQEEHQVFQLQVERKTLFQEVLERCITTLNTEQGQPVRDYLSERGFTPAHLVTLEAGFLDYAALTKHYTKKQLDSIGMYDPSTYPLIWPYRDENEIIQGFVFRSIAKNADPKKSKTLVTKGLSKQKLLYQAHRFTDKDRVLVVEGEFDVITAIGAGMTNIVALGGSSVLDEQIELLTSYQQVILCLDPDDAGRKATEKIITAFKKIFDYRNYTVKTIFAIVFLIFIFIMICKILEVIFENSVEKISSPWYVFILSSVACR